MEWVKGAGLEDIEIGRLGVAGIWGQSGGSVGLGRQLELTQGALGSRGWGSSWGGLRTWGGAWVVMSGWGIREIRRGLGWGEGYLGGHSRVV